MSGKLAQINQTIGESHEAAHKLNEIADNFILVRNVVVGTVAFFSSYYILNKFVIRPMLQTTRFCKN
jgi:hypothetical protein